MSVKVTWFPSPEPSVVSYGVSRATSALGPYTLLATIANNQSGPNFDSGTGQFFYVDGAGNTSSWYTLVANDQSGSTSLPSAPFQPQSDTPTLTATARVDHNYPTPANLRYQTASGAPIENAVVRVFRESDFMSGNVDQPLATVMTKADGTWTAPVYLTPGYNYVVQFAREGLYGPDRVTITV
jgi:hypothetical protein